MLTSADLREALDVAATAAACRSMVDVAEQLMPAVAHLCRADMTIHHQVSLETLEEYNIAWPAALLSPQLVAQYAGVQAQHPFVHHFRAVDDAGPVRLTDLVARRTWRSGAVYSECFRGMGVDDQMTVILGVRDRCRHGMSVARAGRAFCDRDRELLRLVRPSVAGAVRAAVASATAYTVIRVGSSPVVLDVTGEALPPRGGGLTPREWEVLRLLATGVTSAQAARRLGISARTVDKHVEHLHGKLGATCRVDAVARGRELLQPSW